MIITDKEEAENLGKGRLLIEASISRRKNGKYELKIISRKADDGLTTSVFIYREGQYFIRGIETKNSNVFYADINKNEAPSDFYVEDLDSYEEALQKLTEILSEVEKNRNLIREAGKEYHKWVVIWRKKLFFSFF